MSQPSTPFRVAEVKSLGRGLDSLFGNSSHIATAVSKQEGLTTLSVHSLRPGKYQPRRVFAAESMEELVNSVREKGVLQPILVRAIAEKDPMGNPGFEIIAGERRWRAATAAGLSRIPVVIRDFTDLQALETGLIENIQRHDLNALEEAQGYHQLMEEFQYTQDQLARVIGKSRSHIANTLRLLSLPEALQTLLKEGKITAGHARALIGAADPAALVQKVINDILSVRETEQLVKQEASLAQELPEKGPQRRSSLSRNTATPVAETDLQQIEQSLSQALGLTTKIHWKKSGQGEVRIQFASSADLDSLLNHLFKSI
jgi:ParB-like partition proteins